MKTLVYLEWKDGSALNGGLELLTPALNGGEAAAVVIGDCAGAAGQAAALGVRTLLVPTGDTSPDAVAALLEQVVAREAPDLVLLPATLPGKDLAPRLARRTGGSCVTDAVSLETGDGSLIFTRPAYGGSLLERLEAKAKPCFATVRSGSFAKPQPGSPAQVETLELTVPDGSVKARLKEAVKEITELVDLESAQVVVAGGRGMGSAEGFRLVEELAGLLGGVVGASRPAIEEGWVSRAHQIGQSGKAIAPKLYIACGISGAMQHISGVMDAKYIVAVNKDEDAPIFSIADVGIVGDALEILPAMMEELRKRANA